MSATTARPAVQARRTDARTQAWMVVLLLAGIAGGLLRLREITSPLWLDEAYSVWFAALPLHRLWTEVPGYETHPPVYYTLLGLVLPLGRSELVLRLPSVLCSLAVLPLAWRMLAGLPDRAGRGFAGAGLFAAAFCALSALQISYAQEARPYAALTLAASLLLFFGLRWLGCLDAPGLRGGLLGIRPGVFLGFVLAGAATAWLHNVGGLYVAAAMAPLGLVALAHPARWRALGGLVLAGLGIVALYLPNLRVLAQRGSDWSQGTWMAPVTPYRARVTLQEVFDPLALASDGALAFVAAAAVLLVTVLGLGVVARRAGWGRALLLGGFAALPPAVMLAVSLAGAPILGARILVPVTVPVLMLAALGCREGLRGPARLAVTGLLLAGFVAGAVAGYPERPDEPWDRVAQVLATEAAPDAPVLVVRNDAALGLDYYLGRAGVARRLLPVPAPYPALGLPNRYPYGSPALPEPSDADIARAVAETAAAPELWLMERWDAAAPLRAALEAQRPVQEDRRFGPALRLTRFGPVRPSR